MEDNEMKERIMDEMQEWEIPSQFLVNLIEWMRKKGMDEKEIVDCLAYSCSNR